MAGLAGPGAVGVDVVASAAAAAVDVGVAAVSGPVVEPHAALEPVFSAASSSAEASCRPSGNRPSGRREACSPEETGFEE